LQGQRVGSGYEHASRPTASLARNAAAPIPGPASLPRRRIRSGLDRRSPRRRYRVITANSAEQESSRVDQTPRCAPGSGGGHEQYSRVGIGSGLACRHRTPTRGYSLLHSHRLASRKRRVIPSTRCGRSFTHSSEHSTAASPEPWRRSSRGLRLRRNRPLPHWTGGRRSRCVRPASRVRLASRRHARDRLRS
jgi:hypothetical protein